MQFRDLPVVPGYNIVRRLGCDQSSRVYYATTTQSDKHIAIKISREQDGRFSLKKEADLHQMIGWCQYIPVFIQYELTNDIRLIAMECLGPSISEVRRKMTDHALSMSTTLRIGIDCLHGLEAMHNKGLVHRDVKPANMLVRPNREAAIALIDFKLMRDYRIDRTEKNRPKFVGTPKYASLMAHQGEELGPRDDIISLVLSLIEIHRGVLPWGRVAERDNVFDMKRKMDMQTLFRGMPDQVRAIYEMANGLAQNQLPSYDEMINGLQKAMEQYSCTWDEPFDWELLPASEMENISAIDMTMTGGWGKRVMRAQHDPELVTEELEWPRFELGGDDDRGCGCCCCCMCQ